MIFVYAEFVLRYYVDQMDYLFKVRNEIVAPNTNDALNGMKTKAFRTYNVIPALSLHCIDNSRSKWD